MPDYRVIVCGGRDFDNSSLVHNTLRELPLHSTIVHGEARGADLLAELSALSLGMSVEPHPADWKQHGKAAGPIRNQEMLKLGADLLIAFPGGRGTSDMVRRAEKAGIPVMVIDA